MNAALLLQRCNAPHDLVITLSLVLVWMYLDSRERGEAFVPYALVTLFLGAAGPLLYLIRRRDKASA